MRRARIGARSAATTIRRCSKLVQTAADNRAFCSTCAHDWAPGHRQRIAGLEAGGPGEKEERRFRSLERLIAVAGIRRDELATLAEIGALNAFGYDRRTALWQMERAARPPGALFSEESTDAAPAPEGGSGTAPLAPMTPMERVIADYEGRVSRSVHTRWPIGGPI